MLGVPEAPFPSHTGVMALHAASVDPELGEERTLRASARLSQLLDWNAPRLCAKWSSSDSWRNSGAGSTACSLHRKVQLFFPRSWAHAPRAGPAVSRYKRRTLWGTQCGWAAGSWDRDGPNRDEDELEETLPVRSFPVPQAREQATVSSNAKLSSVKTSPPICHRVPGRAQGVDQSSGSGCGCDRAC